MLKLHVGVVAVGVNVVGEATSKTHPSLLVVRDAMVNASGILQPLAVVAQLGRTIQNAGTVQSTETNPIHTRMPAQSARVHGPMDVSTTMILARSWRLISTLIAGCALVLQLMRAQATASLVLISAFLMALVAMTTTHCATSAVTRKPTNQRLQVTPAVSVEALVPKSVKQSKVTMNAHALSGTTLNPAGSV
jgi:hypothetical protein